MEDTIFIKVLEHGEKVGLEGTNFNTLMHHIEKEMGIDFNHPDHSSTVDSLNMLFAECFRNFEGGKDGKGFILKTDYFFRLIEYRKLQEARQAAQQANTKAIWSICISLLAIIVVAVLVVTQVTTPVRISKSDLQALIDSTTGSKIQQEVKLDNLQMAQILSAIESGQSKPDIQKPKAILPSNEMQHHELINRYFEGE